MRLSSDIPLRNPHLRLPLWRAPAPSANGVYVHLLRIWPLLWGIRAVTNDCLTGSEELEPPARWRLLARRGGGRLGYGDPLSQREDVFGDLAVTVADDKGHAAVDGEHQGPAVGDDRVRDLAAKARLDIRRLDAAGAVVAVGDELHLRLVVAELLDDLHEDADVLQAGDLECHERQDHVGNVEHRDHLLDV